MTSPIGSQLRLGSELKAIRLRSRTEDGKRVSEGAFGERFGWSGGIQRRIEKGKIRDDELSKILEAYPELGQLAFASDVTVSSKPAALKPEKTITTSLDENAQPAGPSVVSTHEEPQDAPQAPPEPAADVAPKQKEATLSEPLPLDRPIFAPEVQGQISFTEYGDLIAADEDEEDPDAIFVDHLVDAAAEPLPPGWTQVEQHAVVVQDLVTPTPGAAVIDPDVIQGDAAYVEQPAEPEAEAVPVAADGTTRVSNSEIQAFKRCRRKWWLGWYRGLRPAVEDKTGARQIGIRVHRALKAWYVPEGETPVDPRDALERAIAQDWTELVTTYKERFGDDPPQEMAKQFQDDTSLERAMVEGYLEWIQETGADRDLHVIAPETYVETPFQVPSSDRPVKLIAKLDTRVHRTTDDKVLFIDHKTVGSVNEPVKTLHMDEQFLYYTLIEWLNSVNEGRTVGSLYNMLRKVKRTARATPPFYARAEVQHSAIELDAFKREITGVIAAMLQARAHLDTGTDHHVVAYASRRKTCSWDCDFFQVCPLFDDGSRVDDMLANNFVAGNPLHYYRDRDKDQEER